MASRVVEEFRSKVEELPRERILDLLRDQDPELVKGVKRIEYVFKNKLKHIGIQDRDFSNKELALLLDPPFMEDKSLTQAGFTIKQQRQIHIASDPVLWAKSFLDAKPRVYQILMLRDPKNRKVFRCGRRLGKTWTLAVVLLHYAYTHNNGRCLVMAPMKSQVGLIYDEVIKLAKDGKIYDSMPRHVASPQHEINFTNGSTIRLFTTGMKSGSKSDVARGQEAHIIILDEMDYMGMEDLDALYAMLQKTDENQPDKVMIGASTPSGRRERFWEWCTRSNIFKEFYFPSYVNPMWSKEMEEEMVEQYSNMAFRQEIEADWGEDVEGVYPRKYIDMMFGYDYNYSLGVKRGTNSIYLMGVDWDKYNAGPNIVVLEVCPEDYHDPKLAGKVRVAFREEIARHEYSLMSAVERIIELNAVFDPAFIYVDRGYGEMQFEMLKSYGTQHPATGMQHKVKGISFSESLDVKDPVTKQPIRKEMKPFLVDNMRTILERDELRASPDDEELYMQLISYVVVRTTVTGRPVFEASGSQVDHAHDALALACMAYTQNYGELFRANYARRSKSVSSLFFNPTVDVGDETLTSNDEKIIGKKYGSVSRSPIKRKRSGARGGKSRTDDSGNSRKMF